jgi:CotH kinase protein
MKRQIEIARVLVFQFAMACSMGLAIGFPVTAQELSLDSLLDPARVIEISIEIPKGDWATLCQQNRDPGKVFQGVIENPFTYFKGDVTIDGVTIKSIGIRKRGFIGSLDNHYPSIKVNFGEYLTQSPIKGLDGLTLSNNKQDTSLVSQFLSYQLFNAAGVQAPRCNFARVTVNGEYLGVYTNVESIAKPFLKRRFANDDGNLYEGTLADFYPKAIDRLEIKTNKKNHDLSKVTQLAKLLAGKEAIAVDEVSRTVDIDNFLRFWTMESLISFWDGYTNNQNNYWVYDNGANGKLYFMPWGADMAFMQPPFFVPFGQSQSASIYGQSMLANRLFQDKQIAERYRETMRWQLANTWKEEELLATIDRLEKLLKEHLHPRQSGAPAGMKATRQFIQGRRKVIEKELETWPVKLPAEPRKPMYHAEIGSAKGTFATKFAERAPQKPVETGVVKLEIELSGNPVVVKKAGASVYPPPRGGFFGFGAPLPESSTAIHVVISGVRDGNGRAITLTLPLDSKVLAENLGKPMEVNGSYNGGAGSSGGFMQMGGATVSGKLTLAKADAKVGDEFEGAFELKIFEVHGGFFDRRPQGRGDANR